MLKKFSYFVTVSAILVTLGTGIYAMGESIKVSGLLILLLVIVPYLFGMWVLSRMKQEKTIRLLSFVLILLSVAGTAMLIDAMLLKNDAQGATVFFVLPVFQFPIVLISAAYGFFMQRKGTE